MRKVTLEVEAIIPVKVLLEVTVRADDDANIEQALKRYADGRKYPKADVEDVDFVHVIQIGTEKVDKDSEDSLSDVFSEAVQYGGFGVGKMKVIDSH